tara:strand:+ start:6650 stop:7849 length:1200 start_codon:yes stop_codon:yes gene_type:complete
MAFSFNGDVRDHLEQMVSDPRFKTLTNLPLFAPMEIGLGLLAYCLFFSGTWLYLEGSINLPVMLLMNSFAIYLSFTPLHDATHRTVSRHRGLNDVIGTACCMLLLPGITTRVYRYLHLEHHRYAGNPKKDPDEPFVSAPGWLLPFVLAGLDVLWVRWYLRHWNTRPTGERIEFCVGITFYLSVHVGFLSSPYAVEFLLCFFIPQRMGLFYVAWFFAHIQHPEGVEWESAPLQTTYKIQAGWLSNLLLLGQATHCIHHLAPSVPYYRYFRAWDIGKDSFEPLIPTRSLWRASVDNPASDTDTQAEKPKLRDNLSFEVEIGSTGEVFEVRAEETLLDVLHENGYPVICSCTQGVCGSCLTPVLAGVPEHRDVILSDADKAKNDCMTICVSRAQGGRIVLDL